jgi:hypothetical protein
MAASAVCPTAATTDDEELDDDPFVSRPAADAICSGIKLVPVEIAFPCEIKLDTEVDEEPFAPPPSFANPLLKLLSCSAHKSHESRAQHITQRNPEQRQRKREKKKEKSLGQLMMDDCGRRCDGKRDRIAKEKRQLSKMKVSKDNIEFGMRSFRDFGQSQIVSDHFSRFSSFRAFKTT